MTELAWLPRDDELKDHQPAYAAEIAGASAVCYERHAPVAPGCAAVSDLATARITLGNPAQFNSYTTEVVKQVIRDFALVSDSAVFVQTGPKQGSEAEGGSTDFLPWFLFTAFATRKTTGRDVVDFLVYRPHRSKAAGARPSGHPTRNPQEACMKRVPESPRSPRRRWTRRLAESFAVCVMGVAAALPQPSMGAEYPVRTVRMLVPFAPGGSTDMVARIIATRLPARLGQSFVVENKPGAGTAIAMQAVATAPPDGYTLLFGSSALANYPNLTRNVVVDVQRDLIPVTMVISAMYVVLVHPSVPARTVSELIALAKSKPGQLNIGSAGSGSANHLAGELFKSAAGIDLVHVQYKGSGPALTAAIAGEVQVIIEPIISARSYIESGRLRALAVTGARRSAALPDLPTVAESGVPGFEASFWLGVLAPANTPKAIVTTLADAIGAIVTDPEVRDQLVAQGVEPVGDRPEQFARTISDDIAKWGKVIRDAKVQLQ